MANYKVGEKAKFSLNIIATLGEKIFYYIQSNEIQKNID